MTHDSRTTGPGDLFLCWRGTAHDGHLFLEEAVARGAVAAVVERPVPDVRVPLLRVRNGRRAAALVADAFFDSPWEDLFVAAVTGTNGKTTTALLSRHLLGLREPCAALGTLGLVETDGTPRPDSGALTTPGPVEVARTLRELRDQGVHSVVLEASSHALEQHRLDGIRFDAAVFTNLSQDHLDYHESQEAYLRAKGRLVELLAATGTRVVNGEDPAWLQLPSHPGPVLRYRVNQDGTDGSREGEPLVARDLEMGPGGSSFILEFRGERQPVRLPLLGRFNVENALGAVGVVLARGGSLEEAARGLAEAPQLAGRLEVVTQREFAVVVDFAHTPAALERVLETLKPLFPGRLIVVFGAGGDRDPGKRAPMGRVAAEWADLAIVTSDNPRTEDPEAIVRQIAEGMEGTDHEEIVDRRLAIQRALDLAKSGDVVLLAGKGHERFQQVGEERRPFHEPEIVAELLASGERR